MNPNSRLKELLTTGLILLITGTGGRAAAVSGVEAELLEKAKRNIERHRKADVVLRFLTQQGKPLKRAQVQVKQISQDFLFGCIIFDLVWVDEPYKPELYKQKFKELFNFAVFPFYWRGYEPRQGQTMREKTAELARWCHENGITTKGHPLVWTNRSGVPEWLGQYPTEKTEELLLGRVGREVSGFAGQIDIWDVVNEPVNTRTWMHVGTSDYIREPIKEIADYVEKAFKTAHKANPKAHLILNEYNTIAKKDVRERFFQLVQELKRRQTPISGLGIQAHEPRQHWYPPNEVWATFERLASLGYPLHITEFIPQSGGKVITGGWRKGKWIEQTQAEFAEQFFRLSFGHPAVVSINWWGFSDRRIWLPGGGLLTKEYEPKMVYHRLRKLVHSEWKTEIKAKTDEKGIIKFRGFCGKYVISIKTKDGKTRSFDDACQKDRDNRWVFTLKE
jgi:GH35 family endo-1,4-beta-xylanase